MKRLNYLTYSPVSVLCLTRRAALSILLASFAFATAASADEAAVTMEPLFEMVDLNTGESVQVTLPDGTAVELKLLGVEDYRDPIRKAVRRAVATVEVNGIFAEIEVGNYNLPVTVGGVQLDVIVTSAYTTNTDRSHWKIEKDARFRIWPENSPWVRPGTFAHPVGQRFLSMGTQSSNQSAYIDGGERPDRTRIYYHAGFDFAGYEGRAEVFSATDGVIISIGDNSFDPEDHPPVKPRYDVIYTRDNRGWYYRYSHLKSVETILAVGKRVRMGEKLGTVGKEGHSGGYAHLHFDVSAPTPSGEYGIQDAYAFVWQGYREHYNPKAIAVARPHSLARVGDTVDLDGSRSWAESGIARYEWTLSDGRQVEGPKTTAVYDQPGTYSEILKIVSNDGHVEYDFQEVQILSHDFTEDRLPPTIDPVFHPTMNIQAGDPIHFGVRSFRIAPGEGFEDWDFGDGTPKVRVDSNPFSPDLPETSRHAPDGYAHTIHRFQEAGQYVVTVSRTNNEGHTATGRLHVVVKEAPSNE